jgi:hypothetical protein
VFVTFDIFGRIPLAAPTIDTFVFSVADDADAVFDGSATLSSVQTSP